MASNTISILIKAKDQASKEIRGVAESAGYAEKSISAAGRAAKRVGAAGLVALAGGAIAASKAAWDQVSSVQQATVALNAYEKDGAKVTEVLKDLVNYARSDMGVLFKREDLFKAAQGLKIMGAETENLTEYTKIMSRSVGLGLMSFDELGRVIGRVGSTGRLTGEDFDMLTKAGYQLDTGLRNTNITWEELFKHLDKGMPAEALKGQANTIQGRLIRLQSAFRDVGARILGVNSDMNGFIKGSLGEMLLNAVENARTTLNRLAPAIESIVKSILGAAPAVMQFMRVVWQLTPAIVGLAAAVAAYRVTTVAVTTATAIASTVMGTYRAITTGATVAQVALNTAMKMNPIGLLVSLVVGLVAALGTLLGITHLNRGATDALNNSRKTQAERAQEAKDAEERLRDAQLNAKDAALAVERAQRNYNETVAMYGPDSLEAREAAAQLERAQYRVRDANRAAEKATDDNRVAQEKISNPGFVARIESAAGRIADAYGAIAVQASNASANAVQATVSVGTLQDATNSVQQSSGNIQRASGNIQAAGGIPGNASGTNYAAGGLTLVGERGPELVNLPRGSQVTQAYRTQQALSDGPAAQVIVNITGPVSFQNRSDIDYFAERINKTQRLAKAGLA